MTTETDTTETSAATPEAPARTAKVLTRTACRLRGFTFGKGQSVAGVPLPHAEYLAARGEVEILEIS